MRGSGDTTTFLLLLLLSFLALLLFLYYVGRVLAGLPDPLPEFAVLVL
ncbi:hypothetical protein [Haloparvum sp. PAK95]